MTLDELLNQESRKNKITISFRVFQDDAEFLYSICKKKNIKLSSLISLIVSDFKKRYDTEYTKPEVKRK